MHGLPFVSTYIDIVLVHSENEEEHKVHLQQVSDPQGHQMLLGKSQVTYLGHVFTATGMTSDSSKIQAVHDWPTPMNATALRQFLGLASYHQPYIYLHL